MSLLGFVLFFLLLPLSRFFPVYAYVEKLSFDNSAIVVVKEDRRPFNGHITTERKLFLDFWPRPIRHRLLATGAIEGALVAEDSLRVAQMELLLQANNTFCVSVPHQR
jgi:hypothetical protein